MSSVTLLHRHVFGLKADAANNALFVDDQTVVYPAGHVVVLYSLDDKKQKFLPATEGSGGITALAVSRRFLAVAERGDRALVSIYDLKTLKKRKVLTASEPLGAAASGVSSSGVGVGAGVGGGVGAGVGVGSTATLATSSPTTTGSYVCLEFSADGQLLLTQGGAPDWMLTCWNWAKGKPVACIKAPLHVALHASPSAAMLQLHPPHGTGLATAASSMTLGLSDLSSSASSSSPPHAASAAAVSACSFSNVDPALVCVTGRHLVRYFRVLENAFRPLPSPRLLLPSSSSSSSDSSSSSSTLFLCHAWLRQRDDALLVGTAAGDLQLFHGGELVTTLATSPGEGYAVHSLLATSKGVLCGLQDASLIMYAVNSEAASSISHHPQDLLIRQRRVRVDASPSVVHALTVSPSEDVVVLALASGQLLTLPYQHQAPGVNGLAASVGLALTTVASDAATTLTTTASATASASATATATAMARSEDVEYLVTAFHGPGDAGSGPMHVTGMDVCVRKPLLVTTGLDRTVRVWNYLERSCEVAKTFHEEAYSVACHPSGLYLLVGFADKLRLLNILMDDIRAFKELAVKACRECQFSTGGHLFAAVNGNTIQVFHFLSGDLVANLRGHNGKVRCLDWNHDDSSLLSAGLDGAVYQWDVDDAKREAEYVQKGVPLAAALCNREGTAVYAAGSDRMLKEIEFPSSQLTKELTCDALLGQLVLSHSQRLLFASTAEPERVGAVRCFKFPLTGEAVEFQCLSAPITRLRVSMDDAFLFAAGEDGAVCIMEIRDKEGRPRVKESGGGGALAVSSATGGASAASTASAAMAGAQTEGAGAGTGAYQSLHPFWSQYSEEILVTKSDLEEKNALMLELKNKVDELMLHNEYQLRLKDMTYNENLKELTEKFTHEIELEKNKYELLREDKNDLEMEYEDKVKQLEETHVQQMQDAEAEYQHRIMREVENYQEVLQQREAQSQRWQTERERLVATHDKYVSDVTDDFEQRLNEDRQLRLQMEDEKEELSREYTETIAQVETDVDDEIEHLKARYEDKLHAEREATLRFKGENGIMKKKFSALQKDIEDQRDAIKSLLEKEKDLIEEIKTLEKEIQALKREIRARDETIGEKEKRIYDLKKKNQELEKFKFVLDYKIKELKRQIEPRENEIADMKDQVKEMDRELELFHKSNAQLDLMIGEQRKRITTMQHELAGYRKQLGEQQSWVRRFRCELYACVQHIQDPKQLALEVASLYKSFVTNEQGGHDIEPEIQHEYVRQREYLEKSVLVLKSKYARDVARHQEETMVATSDNMMLIKEINELRSALTTAKATLQMERAAMGAREARQQGMAMQSPAHVRDPDALIDQQRQEMEELRRAIRALEDKMQAVPAASATPPSPTSEGIFPPIRGVDG